MIKRAAEDLQIDPTLSYVVGDQLTDIELASAVGATGILVGRDDAAAGGVVPLSFRFAADLAGAAKWIIERLRQSDQESSSE